jgi:ABC-type bacteriocin/lantibiotic exporter with double-glycine peptidase domain
VATAARSLLLIALQARLDRELVLGFFAHVTNLPYAFLQHRSSGDLMARIQSNLLIRETLTTQLLTVGLDVALILGYFIAMLWVAPVLAVVVAILGVLQLAIGAAHVGVVRSRVADEIAKHVASQVYLLDALRGIRTIKAGALEDWTIKRWTDLFVNRLEATVARQRISTCFQALSSGVLGASPLLILALGTSQVGSGTLSLGVLVGFVALATASLTPLARMVGVIQHMAFLQLHFERIHDLLQLKPEARGTIGRTANGTGCHVAIENVGFRYHKEEEFALRDVTLAIASGARVAIAGPSGAGKSTLAHLIVGLYRPDAGQVRVDGVVLQELSPHARRHSIGVALQRPEFFQGTIRQNLEVGHLNVADEELIAALQTAELWDDVSRLSVGLESRIAEANGNFSGGQLQRLAIARALVRTPPLLVLDEATSEIDVETEMRLLGNIMGSNSTLIVISHRVSTVQACDRVVVMKAGRIVEEIAPSAFESTLRSNAPGVR